MSGGWKGGDLRNRGRRRRSHEIGAAVATGKAFGDDLRGVRDVGGAGETADGRGKGTGEMRLRERFSARRRGGSGG